MRPAGFRVVVGIAVVLAAVGVGLWSAHGSASAQEPASDTIATQLRPGWNLIGWLGPDTTVDDLFRAVPALQLVAAWDADSGRYDWGRRDGKTPSSLEQLTRGQGLYLRVGGTETVQWTRPAADGVVLLRLHAGYNFVTWGGPDATPTGEALDWLGDAVVGASRWNADTRASERYRPGAAPTANTLRTLNHGDALWVRLSEDASWWQSGTAGTEFVFEESVDPATREVIRTEMARVLAFFAERYGVEPLELSVIVDSSLIGAHALPSEIYLATRTYQPEGFFALSHEYFHVFQWQFRQGSPGGAYLPDWLIEGTAQYVQDMYERQRLGRTGDRVRGDWWRITVGSFGPPRPLDDRIYVELHGYWAGALATDWLVRRAAALSTGERFAPLEPPELVARPDHDAHLEFFRLLPESASWEAAFEAAFGISVDDFIEAFEEYLTALGALYLPHMADDRDEPLLVFLGEIPLDTRTRIREQFETAQALFHDRFGSGPVDYTVFVAASDRWAKAKYEDVFNILGGSFPPGQCVTANTGVALLATLANCTGEPLADSLGAHHVEEVLERVAPPDFVTPWLPDYEPPGPYWLRLATRDYATHAYRDALGIESLEQVRSAQAAIARSTSEPLSSSADYPPWPWFPSMDESTDALSFLAGDRLVARAGEPAIFEYYRLLESADSWEKAFESAFGITIEEFYEEFAEHRAAIGAVGPPDAPDEPDGPTLVLLGDMSVETEAALRADFEALQVFFNERFGAEPVDYAAYVATTRPVAEANRDVLGWVSPDTCSWGTDEGDFAMILSGCAGSIAETLGDFHFRRVVQRMAPPDSLDPLPPRLELLGPHWLWVAARSYMQHALLRSVESGRYPGFGSSRSLDASRTEHPLSSLEHWGFLYLMPGVELKALSFVAADWLAQRAGEPALFEYYRLLPSSDSWQEAFEGAFGITIDDFYAAFAEYRAGL